MIIELTENEIGKRIDVAISDLVPSLSRTKVQKLIKDGKISSNGYTILDSSKKIIIPAHISIDNSELSEDYEIIPEDIKLDIVYEDEYIIVINKPAGLVCHPAPGHRNGTLVNALAYHFKNNLSDLGGKYRPGIIHRLDKDTSGLMMVAKSNEAHMEFAQLFANEKGNLIKRKYICFVLGYPNPQKGKIETCITRHPRNRQIFITHPTCGKTATTLYSTIRTQYFSSTNAISQVMCELLTGRTHQIRVHMQHIGCNIIGDPFYGKSKISNVYPEIIKSIHRQALHSSFLEFFHPFYKKWLNFQCIIPADMQQIEHLFK